MSDGRSARSAFISLFGNTPQGSQLRILNGSTNLQAGFTGFYDTGQYNPINQNYFVGNGIVDVEHHNFFVDLAGVSFPIYSAVLSVYSPNGLGLSVMYSLWDVTTPISDLESFHSVALDIFSDLGSGVAYGSTIVADASIAQQVSVVLNADAIAALNAAEGAEFAIGGTLSSVPGPIAGLASLLVQRDEGRQHRLGERVSIRGGLRCQPDREAAARAATIICGRKSRDLFRRVQPRLRPCKSSMSALLDRSGSIVSFLLCQ